MGTVAEESRREATDLLARARSRVKVLQGEEWQRLSLVLERLRIADEPRTNGAAEASVTPLNSWQIATPGPGPGPATASPVDDVPTGLA
jgi:hypothetical protein